MKQSSPDISEMAFRAFVRTTGLFRNRMEPYFARFGISAAQWGVLRALHRAENEGLKGLRLIDLGRRLLVKPPSVTILIDRMERVGLVSRTAASGDLRAKQVMLTPAARKLVARVLEKHPTQIRSVLSCLSEAEKRDLHRLMERLSSHLESLDGGNSNRSPRSRTHVEECNP